MSQERRLLYTSAIDEQRGPLRALTRMLTTNRDRDTIQYIIDEGVLPDGSNNTQHWVNFSNDGASVLPIDPYGNVYLLDEYHYANNTNSLVLPGGMVEPGEEPEPAARRETAEETGLTLGKVIKLGAFHTMPNRIRHTNHVFAGEVSEFGTPQHEATERLDIVTKPLEEALEMVRSNEIKDPATAIALYQVNSLVNRPTRLERGAAWLARRQRRSRPVRLG